jgi:hypothetical protein
MSYQLKLFAVALEIAFDLFLLVYMLNSNSYKETLSTNEFGNINENGFIKMTNDFEPKLSLIQPFIDSIKSLLDDPFNFDIYGFILNYNHILSGLMLARWCMLFSFLKTNKDSQREENLNTNITKIYSRMQNSKLSIIRVQIKETNLQ